MLLLKTSLDQLGEVNKVYRKYRKKAPILGDKVPNMVYIRDVLDGTTIDTYDDTKMTAESMNENKKKNNDTDTVQVPKTILNIGDSRRDNRNAVKPRSIMTAGEFVDTGDIKGFIVRIVGSSIFIEDNSTMSIVEMKLKDFVKLYKPVKGDSVYGIEPVDKALVPKEDKTKVVKKDKVNESGMIVMKFGEFINESVGNDDDEIA